MKRFSIAVLAVALVSCGGKEECKPGPSSVCTVMGNGDMGYKGGSALNVSLYLPMDALFGPDGKIYVVDWNNHRIRAASLPDGDVQDVVGTGLVGDGVSEPPLESALNHPTSLTFDSQGRMVIAAWHNSKVKMLDAGTGNLIDTCGNGTRAFTGDEGPAATASLDLPSSVAFDGDGNLFIMDQANQVIRKVDPAGMIHVVMGGTCVTVAKCADGEEPVACKAPMGSEKLACASDPIGCTKACKGGFADGPALQARMSQPAGQIAQPAGRLAFDKKSGNLYFADTVNSMIRVLTPDGQVRRVAGVVKDDGSGGVKGYSGDGGPATSAELLHPVDVEIADDGTVYFTDTDNSCVRAIAPDGTISTVAGMCGQAGFNGDGHPPLQTQLNQPYGLTLHDGSLYVVDTYNNRVRQVVLH